MNRRLLVVLIILLNYTSLFSQNNNWKSTYIFGREIKERVSNTDGYIIFSVDSATSIEQRNIIVEKTKRDLAENLKLIDQSSLNDSIYLLIARDKNAIDNLNQAWRSFVKGEQVIPINMLVCVYSEKQDAIKRGLMDIMLKMTWGEGDKTIKWLYEGLVYFSNSEMDNCTNHSLEEQYTYLLQNNKLLNKDQLIEFFDIDPNQHKIACVQSAYIVERLLEKYGSEKVNTLLAKKMSNFENTYGLRFEDMLLTINQDIKNRYQESININEKELREECFIKSIYADWHPLFLGQSGSLTMESKIIGNIRYVIPLQMSADIRDKAIYNTPKYIEENLKLLNKSEFNESINIVLVNDTREMKRIIGFEAGGFATSSNDTSMIEYRYFKEHTLFSVYSEKFKPLKHELMHIIINVKWGIPPTNMEWLKEGIATFADPNTSDDDKYTFEEKYVYLLQNNKLLKTDELAAFPLIIEHSKSKIAYSQSAYIVEYLYKKYGVCNLKALWKSGETKFEEIYGLNFEKMISVINNELNIKYSKPINLEINL